MYLADYMLTNVVEGVEDRAVELKGKGPIEDAPREGSRSRSYIGHSNLLDGTEREQAFQSTSVFLIPVYVEWLLDRTVFDDSTRGSGCNLISTRTDTPAGDGAGQSA